MLKETLRYREMKYRGTRNMERKKYRGTGKGLGKGIRTNWTGRVTCNREKKNGKGVIKMNRGHILIYNGVNNSERGRRSGMHNTHKMESKNRRMEGKDNENSQRNSY